MERSTEFVSETLSTMKRLGENVVLPLLAWNQVYNQACIPERDDASAQHCVSESTAVRFHPLSRGWTSLILKASNAFGDLGNIKSIVCVTVRLNISTLVATPKKG